MSTERFKLTKASQKLFQKNSAGHPLESCSLAQLYKRQLTLQNMFDRQIAEEDTLGDGAALACWLDVLESRRVLFSTPPSKLNNPRILCPGCADPDKLSDAVTKAHARLFGSSSEYSEVPYNGLRPDSDSVLALELPPTHLLQLPPIDGVYTSIWEQDSQGHSLQACGLAAVFRTILSLQQAVDTNDEEQSKLSTQAYKQLRHDPNTSCPCETDATRLWGRIQWHHGLLFTHYPYNNSQWVKDALAGVKGVFPQGQSLNDRISKPPSSFARPPLQQNPRALRSDSKGFNLWRLGSLAPLNFSTGDEDEWEMTEALNEAQL